MKTRCTEISGTSDQIAKFQKAIKKPVDQIVSDSLEAIGLQDFPVVFLISLRGTAQDVREHYAAKYPGKALKGHSYTSAEDRISYLSVADASYRVLAHEIGHAAVSAYFNDPVPLVIHEIIAQGAEAKVCRKYSLWSW